MNRLGSDRAKEQLIRVLVYFALTIVPANLPTPGLPPKLPHAVVQPWGDPLRSLDELVASLAFAR